MLKAGPRTSLCEQQAKGSNRLSAAGDLVQEEAMQDGVKRCKNILFVTALGVVLLISGATLTGAADRDSDCRKRIHKAEENLKKEIDRHGEHSRQADKRRHELEEIRRNCGEEQHEH